MKAWTSNKYVLSLRIAIGCDRVMRWWWVGERISEQRKKYYQNVSISIWLLNLELLLLPLVLLLKRARYICGFWFACRSVSLNLMVLYFFKEREEGWGCSDGNEWLHTSCTWTWDEGDAGDAFAIVVAPVVEAIYTHDDAAAECHNSETLTYIPLAVHHHKWK